MKKFLLVLLCLLLNVSSYALDFDHFDVNDINAVKKATKYYQAEYKNKRGTKEAEEDYLKFWRFYIRFVDAQNEKIKIETPIFYRYYRNQAQKEYKQYYKYGLLAKFYDGQYYFDTSNRYLYENFSSYLSEPWQELLKFDIFFDQEILHDTIFAISKKEIEDIIKFYEDFAKRYPELSEKQGILKSIEYYKRALKNYPSIFDKESN